MLVDALDHQSAPIKRFDEESSALSSGDFDVELINVTVVENLSNHHVVNFIQLSDVLEEGRRYLDHFVVVFKLRVLSLMSLLRVDSRNYMVHLFQRVVLDLRF